MNPEKWGGEIEVVILADFFKIQICIVSVEALTFKVYGEQYSEWIYLLYDGIHYDSLAWNFAEEGPFDFDETRFDPNDDIALRGCLFISKELKKRRQFTNTSEF